MPCKMDGKSGAFDPCRFGRGKECETFTGAPLHLHHMGDGVDGTCMSGIECQRTTRDLFGTTILPVLLEGERVHRKHARIAGHLAIPFGQHLGDTIPHHAPPAKVKVERMRNNKRENVARPIDDDGTVTLDRKSWIAVEPSTRRGCVMARRIVDVGTCRFDGGDARSKRGSLRDVVGTHDERGEQTVAEHASRVVGKHPLNLGKGIPTLRKQQLERLFAPLQRVRSSHGGHELCCVNCHC